jgi:hypothetical protein
LFAINVNEASLAGAFLLGFTIGVFTAMRLFSITFGASVRTITRHRSAIEHFDDRESIDQAGTGEVESE